MELRNLNLNLLVTLDAVLTQQSVSNAAEQLQLSQPTVSASLARLRRHFQDDLLVRVGNHYELTPLGEGLKPLTSDALARAERVFLGTSEFNPARSNREFTILTTDSWMESLGSKLSESIASQSDGIRLRLGLFDSGALARPLTTLRTVDGILTLRGTISGVPHIDLITADWVGLAWSENPITTGGSITIEELAAQPWVVATTGMSGASVGTVFSHAMRQMQLAGFSANIAVGVESFLSVAAFLPHTDRIAILPRPLAERSKHFYDIEFFDIPLDVAPMVQSFWWHPQFENDSGHLWLRSEVRKAAQSLQWN
jgi:DNA-binding transcriptional LysR family regulator